MFTFNHFQSPLQLAFQFCHVASPLRGTHIHHPISILPLHLPSYSVLNNYSPMDSSSRNRMLAPQNAQRAQDPARTNISSAVGEIGGRVDQLALVQNTLQNGQLLQ